MEENFVGRFQINLPQVAGTRYFTDHTRQLAKKLINEPYMIPGDYFKYLSKDQFEYIREICDEEDSGKFNEIQRLDEVLVIILMLMHAEGITPETQEEVAEALSVFKMVIAGVGLERKNLIEVRYENISFGKDCMNKIVFNKKEDLL